MYTAVDVETVDAKYLEGTVEAPDNMVWVCGACGKTSRTRYGFDKQNKNVCDRGWDASCMCNAVLCYKKGSEPTQAA
jgi:hypothetical protein